MIKNKELLNEKCDKINPAISLKCFTLVINEILKEILQYTNIDYIIKIPFVSINFKLRFKEAVIMSETDFITRKENKTFNEKHQSEDNVKQAVIQLHDKIIVDLNDTTENISVEDKISKKQSLKEEMKNDKEKELEKDKKLEKEKFLTKEKEKEMEKEKEKENEKEKEKEKAKNILEEQAKREINKMDAISEHKVKQIIRVKSKVEKDRLLVFLDKYE